MGPLCFPTLFQVNHRVMFLPASVRSVFFKRENKDKCDLVKFANSSFEFARWQHRTDGLAACCSYMSWLKGRGSTQNLPSNLTQCVIEPLKCTCHMASKFVKQFNRVHECDRRQTDRPRCGEMCSNRRNRLG